MKIIFFTLLFSLTLQSFDSLYFIPDEGKEAEKKLVSLFSKAKKRIDIAAYTFTNKTLLKALKKAAKRGVIITVISDKKNLSRKDRYSVIPHLAALKNIHVKLLSGKPLKNRNGQMHIKLALIDQKIASFGSANFSYSGFYKNYEILYMTDKKETVTKLNDYFETLLLRSTPY